MYRAGHYRLQRLTGVHGFISLVPRLKKPTNRSTLTGSHRTRLARMADPRGAVAEPVINLHAVCDVTDRQIR